MKTAISVPDLIFEEADALAQRLGLSRSELYARAVEALLDEHRDESTTAAPDRLYAEEPSAPDPVLSQLQLASLPDDEW